MSDSNYETELPKNVVKIEDAEARTLSWQTKYPGHSKAFLIPMVDLLELLTELKVLQPDSKGNLIPKGVDYHLDGIRANNAIGPELKYPKIMEEKLVLVGTVDVGGEAQDQVENSKNEPQVVLSGSGAFDFTRPCPKFCNEASSLYHSIK